MMAISHSAPPSQPSPVQPVAPAPARALFWAGRTLRLARRHAPLLLFLGGVTVFFVWPLAMLAVGAFRTAPPGAAGDWSLAALSVFASAATRQAIANSVLLAASVTALAVALAAVLAFLGQRSDLPGRRWITPAMLLIFAVPSLFYAMGYSLLANPYTGLLNRLATLATGAPAPLFNIESWAGLITVMVFRATALLYLFLLGPIRALNAEQEEASLAAGVPPLGTFFKISLPSLLPALGGAVLLGLIGGLEAFESVLILGQPAGIGVIALRIFDYLNGSAPPAYASASMLAVMLVGVVALLTWTQFKVCGRRGFVSIGGKARAARLVPLRHWRWPLAALAALYLLAALALPVGALVFSSFQPFPGVYGKLTLAHYSAVFARGDVLDAIGNTLVLAGTVGMATMVFGIATAHIGRQLAPLPAGVLRFCTLIPIAMPGLVTALAVTWAYAGVPGLRGLYGTLWLMAIALVVALTPLASQIGQAATAQIGQELVEAARVAGRGALRGFADIVLRLALPGFLAGWFLTAVAVCGSLDIPLLLGGPGLSTVATQIYSLQQFGRFGEASALLVALVGVLLLAGAAFLLARRLAARLARPMAAIPAALPATAMPAQHRRLPPDRMMIRSPT